MMPATRERLRRLGTVKDVVRNQTGVEVSLKLSLPKRCDKPKITQATLLLAENGTTMLTARQAVEKVLEGGKPLVLLEKVADCPGLVAKLARLGLAAEPKGWAAPVEAAEESVAAA